MGMEEVGRWIRGWGVVVCMCEKDQILHFLWVNGEGVRSYRICHRQIEEGERDAGEVNVMRGVMSQAEQRMSSLCFTIVLQLLEFPGEVGEAFREKAGNDTKLSRQHIEDHGFLLGFC